MRADIDIIDLGKSGVLPLLDYFLGNGGLLRRENSKKLIKTQKFSKIRLGKTPIYDLLESFPKWGSFNNNQHKSKNRRI